MKIITNKLFLMLLMVLCANSAHASYDFWVDGIYYDVNGSEAKVTWGYNYNSYSGSVTIPSTVNYKGITYSVTSIGSYAFRECTDLTSITIPESITSCNQDAFLGCNSLSIVNITSIAAWCRINFYGTSSNPLYYAHHLYLNGSEIIDLVIPNSVTTIGAYAFSRCSYLTSASIPNSVTSIGSAAFSGCSGLTSVNIPNSVTTIGASAFYGCTGINNVTIPNAITSIGVKAFWNCSALETLNYNAEDCADFTPLEENDFYYSPVFYNTNISTINIGDEVKRIPAYFAKSLNQLTNITIPNSVTTIGASAFYGCTSIDGVTIPKSVTAIGKDAFNCTGITYVNITDIAAWCKINFDNYTEYPYYNTSNPLSIAHHL